MWEDGKRHGAGTLFLANGDIYQVGREGRREGRRRGSSRSAKRRKGGMLTCLAGRLRVGSQGRAGNILLRVQEEAVRRGVEQGRGQVRAVWEHRDRRRWQLQTSLARAARANGRAGRPGLQAAGD
eukprot:759670-Hanusia_phi.AAC.2